MFGPGEQASPLRVSRRFESIIHLARDKTR
jgi:hypothetical protein